MLLPYYCHRSFYHFNLIFENVFVGWCYCQLWLWQILLPYVLWLMLLPLCIVCYWPLIVRWQMLLPFLCGWWKNLILFVCVIGRWLCHGGRWNNHQGWVLFGRCYSHGGWWNCHWSAYFSFSSEMLSRTSSHMCGRWNLPTFLLRDGLLALM